MLSRRRRRLSPAAGRIALLSALLAVLPAAACTGPAAPVEVSAPAGPHILDAPLGARTGASLVVGDAASQVDLRVADLPGLLYRISTPAGSGLAPQVTGVDGRVRLALRPTGGDGPDTVRIVLNRTVSWDLRLPAGAGEQYLDLSRGRIRRLDVGASGLLELRLPRPRGVVPVTVTGPVATITVRAPSPVRVRLRGGAGSVTAPWAARGAVPAGSVLAPAVWSTVPDRYALELRAPTTSLRLVTS
ncbi:hypothetical protein [Krasilnikovia sp. M28-CT-15]|uniref:hypothetical protein n=1 Tax=Krasilnikovia sp. M28-CT-15 TaxID=3373540 RepID=UPI00399D461B